MIWPGLLPLLGLALAIYVLMLPVTALVPVLHEVTGGRFPHVSSFEKHLFMSVNMIGAFLFAPAAGWLSDRLGRRRNIAVLACLANASILYLMTLEWTYPVYLTLRFSEGCAHITTLTLLMTMGMDRSVERSSGKIMGLMGGALTLGIATGAPLGGVVGQENAINVFFYGSLLMLGLAGFMAFFIQDASLRARPGVAGGLWQSVFQERRFAVPYAFAFIDRLTVGFIVSTLTLHLRIGLGASPREIGLIMAAFLIPFALMTYPSGILSRRINCLLAMIAGSCLYGLFLITVAWSPLPAVRWWMLAAGMVAALMFAPSLVLVSTLAREHNRAVAMSGFHTAGSLGFLMGPLFGGALITLFERTGADPYRLTISIAGGLEILCALLFVPWLARFSRRGSSHSGTRT